MSGRQLNKELDLPAITTGIGSLPHEDAEKAVDFVFSCGIDIPFWPQIPKRDWRELMIPQFAESLPGLLWDAEKRTVRIDTGGDFSEKLADFFEKIFAGESKAFELTKTVAAGYHAFLDRLASENLHFPVLKGHVTGPITFTLGIGDLEKRPIFYLGDVREAAVRLLAAKGIAQVNALRRHCDRVLMFIDEPALEGYGKAGYEGLSREAVINVLESVINELREAGALVGIHVCGNTDWGIVADSGPDIINMDAYDYGDKIALYPKEIGNFLARGGKLAWGIVPTTDAISDAKADKYAEMLRANIENLAQRIDSKAVTAEAPFLLTPSCGLGSRTIPEAIKAFKILDELKNVFS